MLEVAQRDGGKTQIRVEDVAYRLGVKQVVPQEESVPTRSLRSHGELDQVVGVSHFIEGGQKDPLTHSALPVLG